MSKVQGIPDITVGNLYLFAIALAKYSEKWYNSIIKWKQGGPRMQLSFLAEETQLMRLSKLGDSLERLNVIDFEMFRSLLEGSLRKERKSNAGRPPFNPMMMFKILILQRLFNLSDDQTEYQITEKMSF